ncbi:MAG: GNAT family N-acetyltransferase [Marinobacterium sp.]|nr:GNAT family N-acetyltransferase [Marinobacterium sp.]
MNMELMLQIAPMGEEHLNTAAQVHRLAFPRQYDSRQWLASSLAAGPRIMPFVLLLRGQVEGYIIWAQKSGFRSETVLELEQIAIHPGYRHQGLGAQLIRQSLPMVREQLDRQQSELKHIMVTTRADNRAQKLYRRVLGAKVEATLSKLYSADEVVMIARNVAIA